MTSGTWVRLNTSLPATEIGAHSAPTWETLADGGNGEASFDLSLSAKNDHHLLRPGTLMQVMVGTYPAWVGRIKDFDRTSGRVIGAGIQADAYKIPALDGGGNATRDFGVALATAVAAPWSWTANNGSGITGSVAGNSTEPQMIGELLDDLAKQEGKRWGQLPNTHLYLRADPTAPSWLATPDAAVFGTTNEDRPTHLVGRYFNGSANVTTVRGSGSPARAEFRDLTGEGTLTATQANQRLDNELALSGTKTGWVNGAVLSRDQLTTQGGTPAALESVRAGSMIRALGVGYSSLASTSPDMVIGKTRYTAGESVIYVEPVNTAPRTFVDVLAAA